MNAAADVYTPVVVVDHKVPASGGCEVMSTESGRGLSLHVQILLGLVLGAVGGVTANIVREPLERWVSGLFGDERVVIAPLIKYVMAPVGQIFLRMLLMTVIPLVFASLAVGVARLGEMGNLGRVGFKTFAYFVVTMTIATVIGLTLVNTVRPGEGLPEEKRIALMERYRGDVEKKTEKPAEFGVQTFVDIVPRNPIDSAAKLDLLGVIFFALLVGIGLSHIDRAKAKPVVDLLDGLSDVMVAIINIAMRIAPYGVFAFIFKVTAEQGPDILVTLGLYVLVVVVGLAIQMFVVLSVLVATLSRISPLVFFPRVWPIMVTAFTTSSSNATLPTSIKVTEEALGVPKHLAGFVLPLGATMNMNGTALFEGVTVVFLAQVFNIPLTLEQQAIVVVLAVLTAIGAAGVPGGSIPLLVVVLTTVGVPAEGLAIILGVDRFLDMCRTTLNVIGDVTTATFVARTEGYELLRPQPEG